MDVYCSFMKIKKVEKKVETHSRHHAISNLKRMLTQKQVEKAILNRDNEFLVKALLSDDPLLFEIAHNNLHNVCDAAA